VEKIEILNRYTDIDWQNKTTIHTTVAAPHFELCWP